METFLAELKSSINDSFTYYAYADDLVIILNYNHLPNFLQKFQMKTKEFNLIMNSKKSALVPIKNHCKLEAIDKRMLLEIPIEEEYNYLGILINHSGSIAPALNKIN